MAYPSVNFQPTSSFMGLQPINVASATQAQVLGTVIRARDVTYGEGEFIYLAGVASTAAGDAVCYNSKTGVTVRAVDGGATSIGAFAIAMAATTAGLYGWYQISGSGPVNAATAAANTVAYLSSTAGQIDDTGTTAISGLTLTAATSAGFATVQIDRPAVSAVSGTGNVSFASVGSTPNAAGGSASGTTITLQPADATHPGVLTSGAQNIGGDKVLSGTIQTTGAMVTTGTLYCQGVVDLQGQTLTNSTSTIPLTLTSQKADNANFAGIRSNMQTTQTAAGSLIHDFANAGTRKAQVDKDGNFEALPVGSGFILKSPDGTRYLIAVANGGVLSASAA